MTYFAHECYPEGKLWQREFLWEGKKVTLETGRVARQAHGSLLVRYENTTVLSTVVCQPSDHLDFLGLSVHYQEKAYAAGKIPGGFMKREGKPSDQETLISRLIDRVLRPMFPKNFFHEVQVITSVLSYDPKGDHVVAALLSAAGAVFLSNPKFQNPLCGVRMGKVEGDWAINPDAGVLEHSSVNLFGGFNSQGTVMIELESQASTPQETVEGLKKGYQSAQICLRELEALRQSILEEASPAQWPVAFQETQKDPLKARLLATLVSELEALLPIASKGDRVRAFQSLKERMLEKYNGEERQGAIALMSEVFPQALRAYTLKKKRRLDGREFHGIRPIKIATDPLLPSAYGSALFTRGFTQSLSAVTLGLGLKEDGQVVETYEKNFRDAFMLHYNFLPFSVGEAGKITGPGRREIGHGNLAKKALKAILPDFKEFPHVIRLVSEITESDGSSSMATVCGGSLALFQANVPLKSLAAGIAMGLVQEEDQWHVLSDILGEEDAFGDMDFKIAGTSQGITALQMDLKVSEIPWEALEKSLEQGTTGLNLILKAMEEALENPELSRAPSRILSTKIKKEQIRDLIGPGGKVIRELCETTGAKIDIQDDGTIRISSPSPEKGQKALDTITHMFQPPQVGTIYEGIVKTLTDFGAFVRFLGVQEGLVPMGEIQEDYITNIRDVLREGQSVRVQFLGFDHRGKIKLTMLPKTFPEDGS